MSKNVTMRDIARKMNISAVSVSKAISGHEGVSDSLRAEILKVADELGYNYAPKSAEKSLSIRVMVSETYFSDNSFYSRLFGCLASEFMKKGHDCTLEILSHKNENGGELPGGIASGAADGVIVLGPVLKPCMDKVLHLDMPVVFVDNYTPEDIIDCVVGDNVYGSHMLTTYLINKGHKKISFVGTVNATNSITDRYLGYVKALMQHGIAAREDYLIPDRNDDGILTDEFNLPADMPDAFVCNCDETAYHLVKFLQKKGYKIPEDISVVGFDDYIFATFCDPKLTTFSVDMREMSRAAVSLMEEKIKNPGIDRIRRVISGEIIIRDSVKAV
ncbi:MAG: LacI family DNA-binding transcriptional regulator [Lachnospiraceae bacterium]|nr:LacI family DNA-binding transcriptional regulator [Lachnospiraceae bacterium]